MPTSPSRLFKYKIIYWACLGQVPRYVYTCRTLSKKWPHDKPNVFWNQGPRDHSWAHFFSRFPFCDNPLPLQIQCLKTQPPWIKPEEQDILQAEQQKCQGMGVWCVSAADLVFVRCDWNRSQDVASMAGWRAGAWGAQPAHGKSHWRTALSVILRVNFFWLPCCFSCAFLRRKQFPGRMHSMP